MKSINPSAFALECLLDRVYENSEPQEDMWEKGFLESVLEQRKRGNLSDAQLRTIVKIEAKYTDVAIAEKQQWKESWSAYHRDLALKVAYYYDANRPRYYSDIVHRVLSDKENFFLLESDFTKLTNNKYSLKVLKNYEEELKFNVGDTVQIRATNKVDIANVSDDGFSYPNRSVRRKMIEKVGFVIKTDARPVTRAARGSRIYQVLLTGEMAPIYAHESDLKRAKKCKIK